MRILLVDENQRTRELYRALLADAGHSVAATDSYPQATELLSSRRFDLVVAEIQGSEGDQGHFARILQRKQGMPIILHTAWPGSVRSRLDRLAAIRMEKRTDFRPLLQLVDAYSAWPEAAKGRTA